LLISSVKFWKENSYHKFHFADEVFFCFSIETFCFRRWNWIVNLCATSNCFYTKSCNPPSKFYFIFFIHTLLCDNIKKIVLNHLLHTNALCIKKENILQSNSWFFFLNHITCENLRFTIVHFCVCYKKHRSALFLWSIRHKHNNIVKMMQRHLLCDIS
jgi:hypothetical protein